MHNNIGLATIDSAHLQSMCLKIISKHGTKGLSGSSVASLIEITKNIEDPNNVLCKFENGAGIKIRTYEALALSYLTEYYQLMSSGENRYVIGVDIDDRFRSDTDRELYLSDGVLGVVNNKTKKMIQFMPFQQVLAQNILGNAKKDIQTTIIDEINRKVSRRNDYNDKSGLIVSVLPKDGSCIKLDEIIKQCNIESFLPSYLLIYEDNMFKCRVFHLTKDLIDRGISQTLKQSATLLGRIIN